MCQLQCLMNLSLEIAGSMRHLYKGRHQISPWEEASDSTSHTGVSWNTAGYDIFCGLVVKFSISDFSVFLKKL